MDELKDRKYFAGAPAHLHDGAPADENSPACENDGAPAHLHDGAPACENDSAPAHLHDGAPADENSPADENNGGPHASVRGAGKVAAAAAGKSAAAGKVADDGCQYGKVAIVGAGCGVGTLTLRAAELLRRADRVVYDSLIDPSILAFCPPGCELLHMGKRAGSHSAEQGEIVRALLDGAARHPLTVRLHGGDPFVFGRGGEEALALSAAGIEAEYVPGVTSAAAAAGFAGIPLTHRGAARSFRVVTAHTAEGIPDFSSLAKEEGTLIFLMAKGAASAIRRDLLAGGMAEDMPAAAVSCAGSASQQVRRGCLGELEVLASLPAPLVLVVGKVCALPLLPNSRLFAPVLVTGTEEHVGRVRAALAERGVSSEGCVSLCLVPCVEEELFAHLPAFEWLVFTSSAGVRFFFTEAQRRGMDGRSFAGKKFAAIGPHTAEALQEAGVRADLVPPSYTTEALAEALAARGVPKQKVALLRAKTPCPALEAVGEQCTLYDAAADEAAIAAVRGREYTAVTFGSAGGAEAFCRLAGVPERAVCIGEAAAGPLRARGASPAVSAVAEAAALAERVVQLLEEIVCRD